VAASNGASGSQILTSMGQGFVAGGEAAGFGTIIGLTTQNPALIGGGSGAVYNTVPDGLRGHAPTFTDVAIGFGTGALTGGLTGYLAPKLPGRLPDVFKERPFSDYGRNAQRMLNNAIGGGFIGNVVSWLNCIARRKCATQ